MTDEKELTPLQKIEAKRAARKAEVQAAWDAQRAVDLEAVFEIETELGDGNVTYVDVPFEVGSVTLAAVRRPSTPEFKRYQDKVQNNPKSPVPATNELGAVCLKYPADDARKALLDARPGLLTDLGLEAIKLASGRAASEGKG
jgi:hypothetical protein